jgi:hypothetical protein
MLQSRIQPTSLRSQMIKSKKKRKEDPSIPKTHAPLSAPPFAPLVRRRPPSLAALRRSSSSSRPTTADSLANAASRRLQSPIFANFGCSTAGRRRGRRGPASRGAARVGWGLAVESSHGRRCSSTGAGTSMAAPGHPRSPADYKVAAARELPHPAVRCYAGVFAGAPDGREAVDSVARPRPAGGRLQPPSPTAPVKHDIADNKVESFPCLLSNPLLQCYQIDRSGTTGRKAVLSCTICPTTATSPAAARVGGAVVLLLAQRTPRNQWVMCFGLGTITLSFELRFPSPLHALSVLVRVCGDE